ncbi:MAG: methyl-accepting chemotaxis protein [Treponema sp.]|nr:methyl-accepting chemotaxis protein [Treponema sp.]
MIFSRLKISTKLFISSAVFLIPVAVMLLFISSITVGMIRRSGNVRNGIDSLKPAVTVMQNLPNYLNVYLGLEQGDLRRLDDQISEAARALDNEMKWYSKSEREHAAFVTDWESLKKIEKNDEAIYQKYLDYVQSVRDLIDLIGERSRLILVNDITTYYYVSSGLSSIPEASIRLINIGNLVRKNLFEAESVIERWNGELADAQAQGRRLSARPYDGDPRNITLNMFVSTEFQLIRNSNLLFDSDRERISGSLKSAMEEDTRLADEFEDFQKKLDKYQDTVGILSQQYGRMSGSNTPNLCTAAEFLETLSHLNTDLAVLWADTFFHLDTLMQRNSAKARGQLLWYLSIVVISLVLALAFVVLITMDINRSVKSLKTLFKGLNENDLTLFLQINSKDEFGELMVAFNGFLDVLRSTFGSFKQSAQLVSNSVFDLSSSSKEITTTANEQSASVSEIVSTMESSKNLSEQIAFKTTEVAGLAIETQDLSSKGAELREANQNMMEDIRKQNQKIINEIRNLSDMIIRISEAIRIIDGIADQTKLIAFNASLEASSSGEAGARFSVVASEIRRFADNVVESTREIKQKIEEVQGASQTLIAEANNGSKQIEIGYERMSEQKIVFENIVDNSQNVATRSQQISNLSKQQELASSQIFSALKEISAGVKQFVIATSSTSKIAESLNGMSEELKGKVDKYRTET